jgi:hypothetical protein
MARRFVGLLPQQQCGADREQWHENDTYVHGGRGYRLDAWAVEFGS